MLHAFDSLLDSALALDSDLQVVYCNEAFANMIEVPRRRIKNGKKLSEFIQFPDDFWSRVSFTHSAFEATPYAEFVFISAAENEIGCQFSGQIIPFEDKKVFLMFFRDVTLERKLHGKYKSELSQKEDYIKQLDRKLFETSFLFEMSSLVNAIRTDESIMSQALKKAGQTFKFDKGYFITSEENKSPLTFRIETFVEKEKSVEGADADTEILKILSDPLQRNINSQKPVAFLKDGSQFVMIAIQGKNTSLGYLVFERHAAVEMNQSDLELMQVMAQQLTVTLDNEILYYKSITDEKTKLYNARYFSTTLRKEVHRSLRNRSPFGLMVIDIDHFKKFNDSYGHAMGDLVLKHVAMQIKSAIRASDIPSRFGGEEFAVMMVDSPIEGVVMAAERVRLAIEAIGVPTEQFGTLKVTASIGVSICPDHASSEKDLFEAADKALYHAKKSGRNNVQIFDESKMQSIA